MDRLTPEEFEQIFNAYNSGFTEDILSSPDKFDKLKDINKKTRKDVANKKAEKLVQAGLTPNLETFMPKSYTRWYRPFALDDLDTVKDTLSYANTLLDNENLPEDSLEDFSRFIFNFYKSKGINKKYSKDDLWKIYNYYKDSEIKPRDYLGGINWDYNTDPVTEDYKDYSIKFMQIGAVAPSFDTFIEDKVLGNPKVNLDNKLNTLNRLQGGFDRNYQWDTLKYGLPPTEESNIPETPKEEIPKETKVTNANTAPQIETKSTEDIGDLYTYTMNRLSKDNKYRKLGWWE